MVLRLRIIKLFTINEHHNIRILLNRPGFPEIRQHGPFIRPVFHGPAQLGKRHDRNIQLLRQGFQGSTDIRDFLLSGFRPDPPLHELEIIDNQEIQPPFRLETTRLAPHLLHGQPAGIINKNVRLFQATGRGTQGLPIPGMELPRPQGVRIQTRLRTQHPQHQLRFRHFQTENAHGTIRANGSIFGHAQGQRGFTHARTTGDNDEIGRLKPGRQIINHLIPGRHARNAFLPAEQPIHNLHAVLNDLLHGNKRSAQPALSEPEDFPFRKFQEVFRLPQPVVPFRHHLRRRPNQSP